MEMTRFHLETQSSDVVKDNMLNWIKNPQVLEALGGGFGMEKTITKEEFQKYNYGEPIDIASVEKYK